MANYQIVFAPQLEIDTAEFIATWNNNHAQVATARLDTTKKVDFDPLSAGLLILGGIAAGVTTNVLSDLIVDWVKTKKSDNKHPEPEIQEKKLADGTTLLVVVMREQ